MLSNVLGRAYSLHRYLRKRRKFTSTASQLEFDELDYDLFTSLTRRAISDSQTRTLIVAESGAEDLVEAEKHHVLTNRYGRHAKHLSIPTAPTYLPTRSHQSKFNLNIGKLVSDSEVLIGFPPPIPKTSTISTAQQHCTLCPSV